MNAASAYSAGRAAGEADRLVLQHAELVEAIAYHLAGRLPPSVEVDDLIQAGMLGLLEAASKLRPPTAVRVLRRTRVFGFGAR